MGRIENKFSDLKKKKKKALILFMTAGDPSLKKNEALIYAFEKEGVDLIELGVPFSDPLADGPVIQASSQRSLKAHTHLHKILALVARVRKKSQIPILLMSYLNPVLSYGLRNFAQDAKKSGVDGLIVPDLPPEEGKDIARVMRQQGLDLTYLLAPTSTPRRKNLVAHASSGFVYYVSLTGVTGHRKSLPAGLSKSILAAKKGIRLPLCVGFGISTPKQVKALSKTADGIIIGSAVVQSLADHPDFSAARFAEKFVRPLARALGKAS